MGLWKWASERDLIVSAADLWGVGGRRFIYFSGVWKSADTLLSGVTFREVL